MYGIWRGAFGAEWAWRGAGLGWLGRVSGRLGFCRVNEVDLRCLGGGGVNGGFGVRRFWDGVAWGVGRPGFLGMGWGFEGFGV